MSPIEKIRSLVETKNFLSALDELNKIENKTDEYYGLQGLIFFLSERYTEASTSFKKAYSLNESEVWAQFIERCSQNDFAEIDEQVPEVNYFTQEYLNDLLLNHGLDTLKSKILNKNKISFKKKTAHFIGDVLGKVLGYTLTHLTNAYGKIFGFTDVHWTNWYRRSLFTGVLTLAYMRNKLNKKNLFNTYTENQKNAINNILQQHSILISKYRTINGTCNNLRNPMEGAAGTRFQRNVDSRSSNKMKESDILSPNPRLISKMLLTRNNGIKEVPFLNMIAAAWIQFQNHDWISHGESLKNNFFRIPIDKDDEIFKLYNQSHLYVGKTQNDVTRDGSESYKHTFLNEVTHWWDGSQIYGSHPAVTSRIRSFQNGKLRLNEDGTLPLDRKNIEITGYTRNWWVGLSLLHHLFTREHNAICDLLHSKNAYWSDEDIFQTARLINAALMAKIHTLEWNSAINPNRIIYNGNHCNWYGYLSTRLDKKSDWRTLPYIKIANTELGGVVGNPVNNFGTDFGLTQEFVEAYRIHSMLPEEIFIRRPGEDLISEKIPFGYSRQAGSMKLIRKYGLPELLHSLGTQNPGQVVLNNYPHFLQTMSIPGNPIYDLGAVDILRARERGVPRYNEFRRQLGLKPLQNFDELNSNPEIVSQLRKIYGAEENAIENLDFMIGCLAEDQRPSGFALGETMFQLFLLNATRRLQTDRFYTDCYNEDHYTAEGILWIDQNDMKSVILRHFPELEKTGLQNVHNAFEPWDLLPLSEERHPLRRFEKIN